jgi:hypothetical protein
MNNQEVLSVKFSKEMGLNKFSSKVKRFNSNIMRTNQISFIKIHKLNIKEQINYDNIKPK